MLNRAQSRAAAGPQAHLLSPGLAVIALCESTSTSSLHQDTCQGHAQQHPVGETHWHPNATWPTVMGRMPGHVVTTVAANAGCANHTVGILPLPASHLRLWRDAAWAADRQPAGPHDVALEGERLQHALIAAKDGAEGGTRQAHRQCRLGGRVLDLRWARTVPFDTGDCTSIQQEDQLAAWLLAR